jgi:MSHA biogenesis protein MshN
MLQDLEQRRSTEAGVSPLGGLSPSSGGARMENPINYFLLGMVLVLAVLVAAVTAYLFGAKDTSVVASQNPQTQFQKIVAMPEEKSAPVLPLKTETPVDKNSVVELDAADSVEKIMPEKRVSEKKEAVRAENLVAEARTNSAKPKLVKPESVKPVASIEAKDEHAFNKSIVAEQPMTPEPTAKIEKHIRPLTTLQQAQIEFQAAVKYIGQGENQEAHEALDRALLLSPTHSRARETLAALMLNSGRITEASATLREGLGLQPNNASLAKLYARILVDQNDLDNAAAVLERAQSSALKDADYQALLAALYQRTGKYAQAARAYRQVLQVRPGVASWWMGLALSLESMGEINGALDAYNRALKAGGLSADVSQFVVGRIEALTPVSAEHEAEALEG